VTLLVEGDQLSGVTSDLSEGGALVVVPAPVDAVAGQRARVRLTLAADEVLLLDAEVVRLGAERDGERSLGLRFCDLGGELEDRVRRFVLEEQLRRRHASGG
jgi:c-di-GMP-binding flagellar brake protein YcgR